VHPILALTPRLEVARRLGVVWGLEPRMAEQAADVTELSDAAARMASDLGLAPSGERIVIISGPPGGRPGAADMMRLVHAPPARVS
jgi:pyruvate kinase